MGGVEDQIMSLFKACDYGKPKRVKTMCGSGKKPSKSKIKKQSEEENIIKNKRNLFKLKEENEVRKDKIIRDIRTLFEHQEEDYYKSVRIDNFLNN